MVPMREPLLGPGRVTEYIPIKGGTELYIGVPSSHIGSYRRFLRTYKGSLVKKIIITAPVTAYLNIPLPSGDTWKSQQLRKNTNSFSRFLKTPFILVILCSKTPTRNKAGEKCPNSALTLPLLLAVSRGLKTRGHISFLRDHKPLLKS